MKWALLRLKSSLTPGTVKRKIKSIPLVIAVMLVLFILTKLIYELLILK